MSVKITITIEVDDHGKVSVDAGPKEEQENLFETTHSCASADKFVDVSTLKEDDVVQMGDIAEPYQHTYMDEEEGPALTEEELDHLTPFSLEPETEEVFTERMDSPDNITRTPESLIAERADRFAHQFANSMKDDPVIGATIGSLVDDGILDAIEEEAEAQREAAAKEEGVEQPMAVNTEATDYSNHSMENTEDHS